MISLFKHYNIKPIFVFDGKYPKEKQNVVEERRKEKKEAKSTFDKLQKELSIIENKTNSNSKVENYQKETIKEAMVKLKSTMTTITTKDIGEIKELFDLYGVSYVEADGEAEKMCAKMVQKKIAWACLSEDTDLFVYGCTRVLRYISLINRTVVYYNMKDILYELRLNMNDFREICILSGTDYNQTVYNLYDCFKLFSKYKNQILIH